MNVLAAALAIVIAVVSTVAAHRTGRLASQLEDRKSVANENLAQARKTAIQAQISEAEAHRASRRPGQRFETFAARDRAIALGWRSGITADELLRLRNETISALALPDLRVAKELDVPRAVRNGAAVDPTFERYAFQHDDGTVFICRMSDAAELMRFPGLPPARYNTLAAFSPDGRYLAMNSVDHNVLKVWDLTKQRLVLSDEKLAGSGVVNWSFHPDGHELALVHTDNSVVFYELPSGRPLERRSDYPVSSGLLAYSTDGSRLAVTAKDGRTVQVVSRVDGRVLATLPHPRNANHFVWHPRRRNVLAVACENNVIYNWDAETGKQVMRLNGELSNGIVIAYHPSGDLLASRGWHNVLRLWDTRTGREVLSQSSHWSSALAFDRSGRWLGIDPTAEKARILEVADAGACRTLVREPFREADRHGALAIDPSGRRAVTAGSAVTIWDLTSGATLATLPVTGETHRVLFDASGALITELPALIRWPVTKRPDRATTVGPPQFLHPRGTREVISITPDGRTIAAAMYDSGGLVFDTQKPQLARWLRPHPDVRHIAISPDGRFCVTGSHNSAHGMKLWDVNTGGLLHDFPGIPKHVGMVWSFSPDGRLLAVNWDGLALLETTTWTLRVRLTRGLARQIAFAPDSRTAVYSDNASSVYLFEVETGRELARFDDPEQARINMAAFTPDGSRLVMTLQDRHYLRIWDLRSIRRSLSERGLDWGAPDSLETADPRDDGQEAPEPFRVDRGQREALLSGAPYSFEQIVKRATWMIETNSARAEAFYQRGLAYHGLKRFDEAVADFTAALSTRPDDERVLVSRALAQTAVKRIDAVLADGEQILALRSRQPKPLVHDPDVITLAHYCNDLAWDLAYGRVSDLPRSLAVPLARLGVKLTPDHAHHLNTLGFALYRAARHAEAVTVLERSLAAGTGEIEGFDLLFLAMARHRLGDRASARDHFFQAGTWIASNPDIDPEWRVELKELRAEAEAILRGPAGELPADVFTPATGP
jgi:WD40 repeat protein/tetratricopeptide (TPR) repeat protein